MSRKISILGCGWLGESLAGVLVNQGYSVKGSTTSEQKLLHLSAKKIDPFLIKLEDLQSNTSEFLSSEILIISIPSKNIAGFKSLLTYLKESSIQKIVFISSTSVYNASDKLITETSPTADVPLVEIENLFINNERFDATIIRFAGLMGYDRQPGKFFANGRQIPNPDGPVNMIHRDDCVAIILQIIQKNVWNEIFNACADTHPTRSEFYTKAARAIGLNDPIFTKKNKTGSKIISNRKLKIFLNYRFKYPDLLQYFDKIKFD